MKIASNLTTQPSSRKLPENPAKNTWQMDRFELQTASWEADHKLRQLQARRASGHSQALVGMGVLFSSLGIMVGQSLALGSSLSLGAMAPVALAAGAGVATFAHGIWKRDTAEMDVSMAQMDAQHLRRVYQERFDKSDL